MFLVLFYFSDYEGAQPTMSQDRFLGWREVYHTARENCPIRAILSDLRLLVGQTVILPQLPPMPGAPSRGWLLPQWWRRASHLWRQGR